MRNLIYIGLIFFGGCGDRDEPRRDSTTTGVVIEVPQTKPVDLRQFAERALSINKKLSEGRRQVYVEMLTTIAHKQFSNNEHKMFWLSLLSVESKFEQGAKSPANALGLGQLLPQYRQGFAALCGFGEVSEKDLLDAYTNATISACLFRTLIEQAEGSIPLALAAYNAGPSSYSYAQAKKGENPVKETSDYIAKIVLRKHNNKEKD